jgi:hypothetical protein
MLDYIFGAIAISILVALAVKQIAYALMQGSLFDPLRRLIRRKMNEGVFGFETLNELFTCELCMTMQVSLWLVLIPATLVSYQYHLTDLVTLIWVNFVYAMGISGIALGAWRFLEYPAKRYRNVAFELGEAQQTIRLLRSELERVKAKS